MSLANNSSNPSRVRKDSALEQKLLSYASAAVAAGVSMMAVVPPSYAEIVYTPANISVPQSAGAIPLDINNDGITDFYFSNNYFIEAVGTFGLRLQVTPAARQNRVGAINSKGYICAQAVASNVEISKTTPFTHRKRLVEMAVSSGSGDTWSQSTYCPWLGHRQAFLALRFAISGEIHYAWAQVRVEGFSRRGVNQVTILGYAYETVPNKPIKTGETSGNDDRSGVPKPATLDLLASGSSALAAWRP